MYVKSNDNWLATDDARLAALKADVRLVRLARASQPELEWNEALAIGKRLSTASTASTRSAPAVKPMTLEEARAEIERSNKAIAEGLAWLERETPAYTTARILAKDLQRERPGLSEGAAIAEVFKARADLYNKHRAEQQRREGAKRQREREAGGQAGFPSFERAKARAAQLFPGEPQHRQLDQFFATPEGQAAYSEVRAEQRAKGAR